MAIALVFLVRILDDESRFLTSHAIELVAPFNAAKSKIMPLQLSGVMICFGVYCQSVAEYEDKETPNIHLTAEELPWDSSMSEFSET